MPRLFKSWVNTVDDVSLLCVTSDDKTIYNALLPSNVGAVVSEYSWKYTKGIFYCKHGTLLEMLANVYGYEGKVRRIEPNDDYFPRNIASNLKNFNEKFGTLVPREKGQFVISRIECHPRMKYKNKNEWCWLPVNIQNNKFVMVRINKCNAHFLNKNAVFIDNKLYLYPDFKGFDGKYHGKQLTSVIFQAVFGIKGAAKHVSLVDNTDFRIDFKQQCFISGKNVKNNWKQLDNDLWLLEIVSTSTKRWLPDNLPYKNKNTGRVYAVFNKCYDEKLFTWNDSSMNINIYDDFNTVTAPIFVARDNKLAVDNVYIPSRMGKYYQKAVDDNNLKVRAKFENSELSQHRGGRVLMTKATIISKRKVFANEVYKVSDSITALDLRPEKLLIGSMLKEA
jgi:hypothetical protein